MCPKCFPCNTFSLALRACPILLVFLLLSRGPTFSLCQVICPYLIFEYWTTSVLSFFLCSGHVFTPNCYQLLPYLSPPIMNPGTVRVICYMWVKSWPRTAQSEYSILTASIMPMKLQLGQAESIFSLLESPGESTLYPIIAQLPGYKVGTPVGILALLKIKKKAELRDGKRGMSGECLDLNKPLQL